MAKALRLVDQPLAGKFAGTSLSRTTSFLEREESLRQMVRRLAPNSNLPCVESLLVLVYPTFASDCNSTHTFKDVADGSKRDQIDRILQSMLSGVFVNKQDKHCTVEDLRIQRTLKECGTQAPAPRTNRTVPKNVHQMIKPIAKAKRTELFPRDWFNKAANLLEPGDISIAQRHVVESIPHPVTLLPFETLLEVEASREEIAITQSPRIPRKVRKVVRFKKVFPVISKKQTKVSRALTEKDLTFLVSSVVRLLEAGAVVTIDCPASGIPPIIFK